tara:strand:- start:121 stop:465 length:345 start_codon:yes stop_codon:yes gene_type:complete
MIHPLSEINTIANFFHELVLHSRARGMHAAHEVIRSQVQEGHLQQGLTLAADGNHPSIVARYLKETLPHSWEHDQVVRLRRAVELWQLGRAVEEIMECFSNPSKGTDLTDAPAS